MSDREEAMRLLREIHAAVCGSRRGEQERPSAKAPHDPNDPTVKVLPRNWKGEDLRGKRFSECPANFLGMLAHVLDSFADKAEADTDPQKQRYAKWDRENAEAARKWRAKLEAKSSAGTMTQEELDATF